MSVRYFHQGSADESESEILPAGRKMEKAPYRIKLIEPAESRCGRCFKIGHNKVQCTSQRNLRCSACKADAHSKASCPHASYIAALRHSFFEDLTCYYCGKTGHINCSKFPGPLPKNCAVCCGKGHSGRECANNKKRRFMVSDS